MFENIKEIYLEKKLCFKKWNFLALRLKHIFSKKRFSSILGKRTFQEMEQELSSSKIKKFLTFPEMELSSLKLQKF